MGSGLEMIIALVFGYLCGTIPFGLILTKSAGLGDIRTIGSGNIGATNVLRTGNKKVAALTLILDALKGAVPALVMGWLYGPEAGALGGLAAFFGHLFPMWLGFKGGKGVATNIGVLFGLFWPLGLIFLAAGPLIRIMGDQIAGAITRIFGVILSALAVQMIIVGVIGAFGLQGADAMGHAALLSAPQ